MSEIDPVSLSPFERAARLSAPAVALAMTGHVGEGYWLDDDCYFFCVDERDSAGRLVSRPRLADANAGTVVDAIAPETLAALIAGKTGKGLSEPGLAGAQYQMPSRSKLVVMIGTQGYHVSLDGPVVDEITALDPVIALHSPDGSRSAYLDGDAVWVKDSAAGTSRQITPDGEPCNGHGTSPESGIAPLSGRKIAMPNGLWSADSQWFATHRIDERDLPEGGLVENAPAGGGPAVVHRFKVARPFGDIPKAEISAYHVPTGRAVVAAGRAIDVHVMSPFLMRHCWFADGALYFLDANRFHTSLALVEMRLADGAMRTVLRDEVADGWIDVHQVVGGQPMIRVLPASNEVIWWSQSTGLGHLYLHDLETGGLTNPITRGNWSVRELLHVDEARRRILFLASGFEDGSDPGYRRLCTVNFDGSGFAILLAGDRDIGAAPDPVSGVDQLKPFRPSYAPSGVSPTGNHVVLRAGAADKPTRTILFSIEGGREIELGRTSVEEVWTAPMPQPFEVFAADGATKLRGVMYFPTGFDEAKRYPLVDYIYPGPQLNWFLRRFPDANGLTVQPVAELGMIGIVLETRGMPGRGRDFHQAGKGRLLEPQLGDHAAAIAQLCERHGFIDPDRIGIFGQSGGGHAAARALFDYPHVFKVGVAVCGNHDCRNYVAHWLDKYGGPPGSPEREDQSNIPAAHRLEGKLLLVHGDMDDNVHPSHTLALADALIGAGKDFEQLIVPGAGHGVMLDSPYAVQRIWSFLARHLLGSTPPGDFTLHWTAAGVAAARRGFSLLN